MKHRFLFAIFFPLYVIPAPVKAEQAEMTRSTTRTYVIREKAYVLPASIQTRTPGEARALAPVAEQISRQRLAYPQQTISGILPRLATARNPAQMISPLAPRDLGAGWNLVSFTDRDPFISPTPNIIRPQPTGLRVFGIREIW